MRIYEDFSVSNKSNSACTRDAIMLIPRLRCRDGFVSLLFQVSYPKPAKLTSCTQLSSAGGRLRPVLHFRQQHMMLAQSWTSPPTNARLFLSMVKQGYFSDSVRLHARGSRRVSFRIEGTTKEKQGPRVTSSRSMLCPTKLQIRVCILIMRVQVNGV